MKQDANVTVGEALSQARSLQLDNPSVTQTAIQALLAYVTGQDRAWLLAHPEAVLSAPQGARFAEVMERLAKGEPLAYLTGEREFCGLSFVVTPDVLIPRPETEDLIDDVVRWLEQSGVTHPRVIDVGTGSGALAVTLAVRLAEAHLLATDISLAALQIARMNARQHQVDGRISFIQANLLDSIHGLFDVIVANLPYIASDILPALDVHRWEPALALDGGPTGLDLVRRLLSQAPKRLECPGLLLLEIGFDQGEQIMALCSEAFPRWEVEVRPDLAGHDRRVKVVSG